MASKVRRFASLFVGVGWMPMACAVFDRDAPPPYGEVLLVVDTDLPVPRVATRLRIDAYTSDGTWLASRDELRPDPRDWPVSFSVTTDDEQRGRQVLVRLRAYPEGRQIPYRGLTYATLPDLLRSKAPSGNGQPRLVRDGSDVTPALEPDPVVTVDRLVRVRLEPGVRGRALIVLRGACAGRQARLAPLAEAASCTDGNEPLTPLGDIILEEDLMTTDIPSVTGTYGNEPCTEAEPRGERVCVPGGAFILGDAFYRPQGLVHDGRPERIVRLSRFVMDRDEVTVERFRDALARGFVAPNPVEVWNASAPPGSLAEWCSFTPEPRGHERDALACVSWMTAEAFCRFEGGALPTEAQWEYAALAASRPRKTIYPWGDEAPSCTRAVYGRSNFSPQCIDRGAYPVAVDNNGADVNPLGLRNLAGGLEEYTADSYATFRDDCWTSAPSTDPSCKIPTPPACLADPESLECRTGSTWNFAVRGGSWSARSDDLRGTIRSQASNKGSVLRGLRCVYSARTLP